MKLRVHFAETDQMGVAHHGAYVVWCEAARIEWLRQRGISYRDMELDGVSLAVSALELVYRLAARFDDLLDIAVDLEEARSRRFVFRYTITLVDGDRLLATGRSEHVPTDSSGRARRLPQRWRLPLLTAGRRADDTL